MPALTGLNSEASGVWTLRDAERFRRAGTWPSAPSAPSAPTSVTGTAGNAQAALSWAAPASNGGVPIADYIVQFSSDSGSSWTTFADGVSAVTSATVTGLTNGTTYVFRVAAVNSAEVHGDFSAPSASVTPSAVSFVQIPEMTSNSLPSGQVLTFGSVLNGYLDDGSAAAWFWFARKSSGGSSLIPDTANQPVIDSATANSGVGYMFASGASLVSGFQIAQSARVGGHYAAAFTFQGSNDGVSWTTISTHSGLSGGFWAPGVVRSFSFSPAVAYSRYRWLMTSAPNQYVEWSRVQLLP